MEPRRRRPSFPAAYGISSDEIGMLEWTWAEAQLAAARNYWVVTASAPWGPHAVPVWGLWHAGAIVFSTSPQSRKARDLAADPRVVVHLESGDDVVIVEGLAEPAEATPEVVDAYERKYAFRPEEGGAGWHRVVPARAYAWREESYTLTATGFDWRPPG